MKTVTVSNVRQLRRAVRDPKVEHIDVVLGTYRVRKPLKDGRPAGAARLSIDGHGSTFVFPGHGVTDVATLRPRPEEAEDA